jgi:hypothetical protein
MSTKSKSAACLAGVLAAFVFFNAAPANGGVSATQPSDAPAGFAYAGQIIDQRGQPVANVEVIATHRRFDEQSFGYIDSVKSNDQGRFLIQRETARSGAHPESVVDYVIRLDFKHADYLYGRLEDLHLFSREQATHLKVTLSDGRSIKGQVVDAEHHPVAGALIEVTFGKSYDLRKGLLSDADGRFEFHGLSADATAIDVLTLEQRQPPLTGHQDVGEGGVDAGVIVLTPIVLPAGKVTHELFGMKLVDVDEAIQKMFHLSRPDGVLIIDPGPQSDRLEIGELKRGDSFWMVGESTVKDFAGFKKALQTATRGGADSATCRVVYNFRRPDFEGSNTQYIRLTRAQIAELSDK